MAKQEEYILEDILMLKEIGEEQEQRHKNGRRENLYNTIKKGISESSELQKKQQGYFFN